MAKKSTEENAESIELQLRPVVAAMLAGVIYQSRLLNRQAKLNIPEQEVITDVVNMWYTVMEALGQSEK
ncbi:MAG: hypothetical protein ABSB82_20320 [Terriglobia bacterium]|jgi:hypothetical protein